MHLALFTLLATAPCSEPERHQLDFWLGDWDLVVTAKGVSARGVSVIRAVLGGCAIEENFHADGPDAPWAGRSFSTWVPSTHEWRQTWVDDSGEYLAFRGGVKGNTVVLSGERDMRMVFKSISPGALEWTWEKAPDWKPLMTISYQRRATAGTELDFWVGNWRVTEHGKPAGTNRIEKKGAIVEEHWRDVDGWEGQSLFFGAPAWKQVWTTPKGSKEKELISHGPDGVLRFQGELPMPDGGVLRDRTTLTPLPDGGVHQLIETSPDDGAHWTPGFDGVYERMK